MNKSMQREAILSVLRSTVSHPTAEWIFEKTKEILPSISFGTVYRNLNQLISNGYAIKVQGTFEKDRYDGNPDMHAHFVCKTCREVTDVFVTKDDVEATVSDANCGEIDRVEMTIFGVCAKCIALQERKHVG